jgi:hypothetical protein
MRQNIKQIFWGLLILFIYRIVYYGTNSWFSRPTLQGTLLFILILLGLVFSGVISFIKPILDSRNKIVDLLHNLHEKPGFKQIVFVLLTLLILSMAAILLVVGKIPPRIIRNFDVVLFILVFSFQFMFIYNGQVNRKWLDQIYFRIANYPIFCVFILFMSLVIAKRIIIFPNAYTLIAPADGQQYWSLARQFFNGAPNFVSYHHYPPLYSLVISPVFLWTIENSIQNISIINIVLSSSAVFPIFLIAKNYLSKPLSLFITFASLFYPYHFVFPYYPASENLYYPLFLWILFFLVQNPENQKFQWVWDAFTGLLIGLAYLTRYQTLPLLAAFFLISWLKPKNNQPFTFSLLPNKERIQRILPLLITFGFVFFIWLVAGSRQGVSIVDLLGFTVEGKESLLRITKSFLSSLTWLSFTFLYFILIAAPVFNIFIYSIFSKKKKIPANVAHWLFTISTIAFILFVTVFRHAWIAHYNYPIPHRLVTRYCIYLAIPCWITGLILLNQFEKINYKKFLFSSVISLGMIWLGYQLFFNLDWILQKKIVIFLYIDGDVVGFLKWKILVYLGISSLAIAMMAKFNKYRAIAPLVIATIVVINFSVINRFQKYMMNMELPGRLLTEIQTQLVNQNAYSSNLDTHYVIQSWVDYVEPEHQLSAKGLNPEAFTIYEIINKNQRNSGKRFIYLTIKVNNDKEYFILGKQQLNPGETIISEFRFNKKDFILVEP